MSEPSPFDLIAERVERLLLRHEEVQRTNALLLERVEEITRERDVLRSRLLAARGRIDALIERLPVELNAPAGDAPQPETHGAP